MTIIFVVIDPIGIQATIFDAQSTIARCIVKSFECEVSIISKTKRQPGRQHAPEKQINWRQNEKQTGFYLGWQKVHGLFLRKVKNATRPQKIKDFKIIVKLVASFQYTVHIF